MTLKLRLLLLNMLGLQPLMISEHRLVVSVMISSLWNEVAVERANRKMPVLMEIVNF